MEQSFEHYIHPHTNIMNNISITHTEYATTWFLIGIMFATIASLVIHIRNK